MSTRRSKSKTFKNFLKKHGVFDEWNRLFKEEGAYSTQEHFFNSEDWDYWIASAFCWPSDDWIDISTKWIAQCEKLWGVS